MLGCAIVGAVLLLLLAGGVALMSRILQPLLPTPAPVTIVDSTTGAVVQQAAGCTPVASFGQPGYMSGYVVDVNSKQPIANADVKFSVYTETECGPVTAEWHMTTSGNGFFSSYPNLLIAAITSGNNRQNLITVSAANCQTQSLPFDSVRDFSHNDAEGTYVVPTPFLGNTIELVC